MDETWPMDITSPDGDLHYDDSTPIHNPKLHETEPMMYVNDDVDIRTPYEPGIHLMPKTPNKKKKDYSPDGSTPTIRSEKVLDIEQSETKSYERLQDFSEDENKERGNWTGKLDFLLSCLGYAVGLGNVWRFPYLCYRNGGGAFFIPYFLMMTFVGLPLFFMELSLGQFTSSGPFTCWEFAPLFRGIGVAMWIVSFLVNIYYNLIIAWSFLYLCVSFTDHLPWDDCNSPWNTKDCSLNLPTVACNLTNAIKHTNGTCYQKGKLLGLWNETVYINATGQRLISPSEEYYNNRILRLSSGIEETGVPHWDLTLCLLAMWILVFFCMIKGVKSSGKVVYFTALFPYVVLFILFFRGVSLPGAGMGVYFYVVPDWVRLTDAKVWIDAAVQIFFSLSVGWGGLITLSSYNRFHNNTLRDSLIVVIGNCSTSVFAGFVIFSFLGYMAETQGTTVDKVASSGPGLAFIVYPSAVALMPVSPLWAVLFFLMLLTLGLDSQFAGVESIVTSLLDKWPELLRPRKTWLILAACVVSFLLGIPLCTSSGAYLLQLMDTYAGGWSLLLIGLTESIALSWVYGCSRFFSDIQTMLGTRPTIWWRICWQGMTPILVLGILIFTWVDYSPAKYGNYNFPMWADAMGWLMSLVSVMFIPAYAIYVICKEEGTICQRIRAAATPTIYWGPALIQHRRLVSPYVEGFYEDPWNRKISSPPEGIVNEGASLYSLATTQSTVNGCQKSTATLTSAASAATMKSFESTL